MAQRVKNPPAMQETQETWVRSLGWEDPLEKEMATRSSILAWEIPWTEEPGGLQPKESQKSQSIMNNAITEIKSTLEGTNSRVTEAEDRISEVEDRMVEINEAERKKMTNTDF